MRIYFDENFSHNFVHGLAEIQDGRRSEGVSVIFNPDEFGRGSPDEEWIPKVAAKHGIIITQDTNIFRVKAQWQLCQDNKVGIFFLQLPQGGFGYWQVAQEIVMRWHTLKELAGQKRPFGYTIQPKRSKLIRLPVSG